MDARTKDLSRGIEAVPIGLENGNTLSDASDFVYVRCNIPGPSISRKPFQEQYEGCECLPDSGCSSDCGCVTRVGRSYDDQRQLLNFDPYAKVMKPVYECNKECRCAQSCFNRVVQHGVQIPLQVFQTKNKGFGLRTLQGIPRNQFVCEYAGEVLSFTTAKQRTAALSSTDSNYILVVKEHHHLGQLVRTIVDPMYIGNIARFMNHSCEPNLYMVPVRVNNSLPHFALFALRDISANEELCYDYSGVIQKQETETSVVENGDGENNDADDDDGADDPVDRKQSLTPVVAIDIKPDRQDANAELGKKACQCGASMCRGYLPFDESLYNEDDGTND